MSDQPEGKPTVSLPAMTDRALLEDLRTTVKEGFRNMGANIEVVSNDLGILKQRVSIIEGLRTEDAMRATKLSGGVRGLSTTDAEQAAQLAQERAAREALANEVKALTATQETQLAILSRLDKVASNPLVKTIVTILGTALATWAASKGLK